MISAFAPFAFARPMLSRMKSSTAGLMLPSIEITSTWGAAASFVWAMTEMPAARRATKQMTLKILIAQFFDDFLDVFPHQFFVRRVAQQIGGMECRHEFDAVITVPVAAHLGNRNLALKQRLHGELAESDDDLGTNEIDLFSEKRLAGGDFIRFRIAIFRWPAFDDVRDVNVVALEPHTFGDDVGQKLAGASDKGLALKIFVAPRSLADKHQLSVGIAHAKNQVGPPRAELTTLAIADRSAQLFEALRLERRRVIGKEIIRRAPQQIAFLGRRRLHSGRFTFGQCSNPGALAPLQMAPQRCRQRSKLIAVANFLHGRTFLSRTDLTTGELRVAITPNAPTISESSALPSHLRQVAGAQLGEER